MVQVDIRIDPVSWRRMRRLLAAVPQGMPRVVSRAINKTAVSARAKVVRALAGLTGLRQKDIRDRMRIRKATYRRWWARIHISPRRIPLIRFGARQTRKGVTYRGEGRKRQLVPGAFIATMPGGELGVFKRSTGQSLPIYERFGPSLGMVYANAQRLADGVLADARSMLDRNIVAQTKLLLEKHAARATA